jgi:hypothetical protein
MDAFGMVYPQYWLDLEYKANFVHLVAMEKKRYSKQLFVNKSKPILELDLILSLVALNMQANLFKLIMWSNATTMLQKPFQINPMTRMWQMIDDNSHL